MSKPRKRGYFKACRRCKALEPLDAQTCSVCGSSDFTEEWSGLIIILDTRSKVAKMLGIERPGRYAVKLGS